MGFPVEVSERVAKKYTVANDTFKTIANNSEKNRLEVEVGDSKQPTFYPQVKLMRWDNEVNFSARLIDEEAEEATITTSDSILWKKSKKSIKFYDLPESEELPEIPNDACLCMMVNCTTTTTGILLGAVDIIEG